MGAVQQSGEGEGMLAFFAVIVALEDRLRLPKQLSRDQGFMLALMGLAVPEEQTAVEGILELALQVALGP